MHILYDQATKTWLKTLSCHNKIYIAIKTPLTSNKSGYTHRLSRITRMEGTWVGTLDCFPCQEYLHRTKTEEAWR